jgi:predicted ATPase
LAPNAWLSNFAAWFRHLRLADESAAARLRTSLQESIDGSEALNFKAFGQDVYRLTAQFVGQAEPYCFDELSEGQRCLICLYAILHFVLEKGGVIVVDEPDNFLGHREIQLWLLAAGDAAVASGGQLIVVSHHPEIINLWAPSGGIMFDRDDAGPVKAEPFRVEVETMLTPAELIARGWERE